MPDGYINITDYWFKIEDRCEFNAASRPEMMISFMIIKTIAEFLATGGKR